MANSNPIPPVLSAKEIARFWSKVHKGPHCWLWTGGTGRAKRKGYGVLQINKRVFRAHRIAVFLATGQWPVWPVLAMHHCDTPLCCRYDPRHIQIGTLQQNRADCVKKGRHARGERQSKARLTERDINPIRARLAKGIHQTALAREYKVGITTIWNIAHNLTWRHVPHAME